MGVIETVDAVGFVLSRLLVWSVVAFAAVLFLKMLKEGLEEGGLLSSSSGGDPEPERVISLAATVTAAVALATESLSSIGGPAIRISEPSELFTWFAGGGQLTYLIGKSVRTSS
jgi:hypothetical protein